MQEPVLENKKSVELGKSVTKEQLGLVPERGTGFVYVLKFPNNKCYVGQTIRRLSKRLIQHCYHGSKCHGVSNAIRKYGVYALEIYVLHVSPVDLLDALEQSLISDMGTVSPTGYNITAGGRGVRIRRTPESKAAQSARMKNDRVAIDRITRFRPDRTGMALSETTRSKIGNANKGRKPSAAAVSTRVANQAVAKRNRLAAISEERARLIDEYGEVATSRKRSPTGMVLGELVVRPVISRYNWYQLLRSVKAGEKQGMCFSVIRGGLGVSIKREL